MEVDEIAMDHFNFNRFNPEVMPMGGSDF